MAMPAIGFEQHGAFQADMPQILGLGLQGNGFQPGPVDKIFRSFRDGDVLQTAGGDVLEKMAPLGGIGLDEIAVADFNDRPGLGDIRPPHGDAQPTVGRAPPPGTCQQILAVLLFKASVQPADFRRDIPGHPPRRTHPV